MRLSKLGAPDEVPLVSPNKIEPSATQNETKPAENRTREKNKRYCFYRYKFGNRQIGTFTKKMTQITLSQAINLNATLAANQTKRKIVGRHNQMTNQNTRYASPAFRGNSGREGIHHRCIRTN